jgi:hypothetical protein
VQRACCKMMCKKCVNQDFFLSARFYITLDKLNNTIDCTVLVIFEISVRGG